MCEAPSLKDSECATIFWREAFSAEWIATAELAMDPLLTSAVPWFFWSWFVLPIALNAGWLQYNIVSTWLHSPPANHRSNPVCWSAESLNEYVALYCVVQRHLRYATLGPFMHSDEGIVVANFLLHANVTLVYTMDPFWCLLLSFDIKQRRDGVDVSKSNLALDIPSTATANGYIKHPTRPR